MTQFDQRSQNIQNNNVGQQYNAGHNISFGAVPSNVDLTLTAQLQHLQQAAVLATEQGLLPEETGIDVEIQLRKALAQARKPTPEKKTLLDHLTATRTMIEASTTASDLVPAVVNAIETVHKLL